MKLKDIANLPEDHPLFNRQPGAATTKEQSAMPETEAASTNEVQPTAATTEWKKFSLLDELDEDAEYLVRTKADGCHVCQWTAPEDTDDDYRFHYDGEYLESAIITHYAEIVLPAE